jgi:hypothetical protein
MRLTSFGAVALLFAVIACSSGGSAIVDPDDPQPVTLTDSVVITVEEELRSGCVPILGTPDAVMFYGKWLNYANNYDQGTRLFYGHVDYWDETMPEGEWEMLNGGSVADSLWTIGYCVNSASQTAFSLRATAYTIEKVRSDSLTIWTFVPDTAVAQWDHVPSEGSPSNGDRQESPAILLSRRGEVSPGLR